ncbi:MAG: transporter permease [Bacilli bacterium]|nr:transporter permease [Bacilli bacterium]
MSGNLETNLNLNSPINSQAHVSRVRRLLTEMWKHRLSYLFIAPFLICFVFFIILPIIAAVYLSFTYFNTVQSPYYIGWLNYQNLFSQDTIFLQYVLPNTFRFAVIVGPVGYVASFFLAWLITQVPKTIRGFYALAIYAPSLTAGVAMSVVWGVIFAGARTGYLNSMLLQLGWIDKPILWVTDKNYLMNIMIIVSVWAAMGLGFLAMIAGILNVNPELYEAGRIDGIKSRLEEIWYITIPSMKAQMLFSAVMAIVGTFKAGAIGVELSGQNPTPEYAGQLITNHIDDYGFIRFEMGYAAATSVVLLVVIYLANRLGYRLFGTRGDE